MTDLYQVSPAIKQALAIGAVLHPPKLTPEQRTQLRADWLRLHNGARDNPEILPENGVLQ